MKNLFIAMFSLITSALFAQADSSKSSLTFPVTLKCITAMISVIPLITNDHLSFTISTDIMKRTWILDSSTRVILQKMSAQISD